MHDLVCITRQHERPAVLAASEQERELGVGKVLHLIDDDGLVGRLHERGVTVREEIGVVELRLLEPGDIMAKERVYLLS